MFTINNIMHFSSSILLYFLWKIVWTIGERNGTDTSLWPYLWWWLLSENTGEMTWQMRFSTWHSSSNSYSTTACCGIKNVSDITGHQSLSTVSLQSDLMPTFCSSTKKKN